MSLSQDLTKAFNLVIHVASLLVNYLHQNGKTGSILRKGQDMLKNSTELQSFARAAKVDLVVINETLHKMESCLQSLNISGSNYTTKQGLETLLNW